MRTFVLFLVGVCFLACGCEEEKAKPSPAKAGSVDPAPKAGDAGGEPSGGERSSGHSGAVHTGGSGGKTVHVNGYVNQKGTYVAPHSRSAPRR